MAILRFYVSGDVKHFASFEADAVPRKGELVNIKGGSFRVDQVFWDVGTTDGTNVLIAANILLSRVPMG